MSSSVERVVSGVYTVPVPLRQTTLVPPHRDRVRALRRHLVDALRDLREAKRPERLIQPPTPEPDGFAAAVVREGCTQCQGFCCRGGEDHAYIDDRTMARVRRDRPELDAAAIIALYTRSIAAPGVEGSCLFHGATGCTLDRSLRAELCNLYYCNGLRDFLRLTEPPAKVRIEASRGGVTRRSEVLAKAALANKRVSTPTKLPCKTSPKPG